MWDERLQLGRRCADCKDRKRRVDHGRRMCKVCGTFQKFGKKRSRPYCILDREGRDVAYCRKCADMMEFDDEILGDSIGLRC